MRPVTFGRRAFRKLRHLLDKPYTWLEVKEAGARTRAPLNHAERCVWLELRHFLDGTDLVVYDVGASYGGYSATFAKLRNVARVLAFEPLPDVYEKLTDRLRPFSHASCFNVALGDQEGSATFHRSAFTYSSSMLPMEELHKTMFPRSAESREISVRVARLDDLVDREKPPPPDFIKMDVQGFEDRVLRGGENVIRQARYCMLEMSYDRLYQDSPLYDDVYSTMRRLGFRLIAVADQVRGETGRPLQVDGVFERMRGEGSGA